MKNSNSEVVSEIIVNFSIKVLIIIIAFLVIYFLACKFISYEKEQIQVHRENLLVKRETDSLKELLPIIYKFKNDSSFRKTLMNEYYTIKNKSN